MCRATIHMMTEVCCDTSRMMTEVYIATSIIKMEVYGATSRDRGVWCTSRMMTKVGGAATCTMIICGALYLSNTIS